MPNIKFLSLQVDPPTFPPATRMYDGPGPLARSIIIKADLGNQGNIYIGNDGADNVDDATGFVLAAGEVLTISSETLGPGDNRYDLRTLHLIADKAGDKVYALWLRTD